MMSLEEKIVMLHKCVIRCGLTERGINMRLNRNQKKNIIYSLVMNMAIFIVLNLLFYSTYESQLDEMVLAALCGVSGIRTSYVLFSNIILGKIWVGLISAIPTINWYFLSLVFSVFLSLFLIAYIILKRSNNKIGITVSFVFIVFLGYECYIFPGSMKTASLLVVTTLMIFVDSIESNIYRCEKIIKRIRKYLIIILAILASLLNFPAFIITAICGVVCVFFYGLFMVGKNDFRGYRQEVVKKEVVKYVVSTTVIIFSIVFFFQIVDIAGYWMTGQMNALKYRSTVIRMYGYGMGDYDEIYEGEYGIDNIEYRAIKNGSFGVSSEDGWQILDDFTKAERGISFAKILKYFKKVPIMLFKYGIFYLYIIMLFMLFFSRITRKKEFIWLEIGLLIWDFFVLYLFGACWNNCMIFSVIVSLLLPLLFVLKDSKEAEYQYLWAYLVMLSIVLYSKFSPGMVFSVSNEDMSERLGELPSAPVNMIDLNAYFKTFSAWDIYMEDILWQENLKISNGAYALVEGFEDKILTKTPSDYAYYEWVYNPNGLDPWKLVFDD